MAMTCNDFQRQYLANGGGLTARMAAHMRDCPECAGFAQVADLASGAKPSPSLESRIRQCCLAERDFIRRRRRRTGLMRSLAAAAALVVAAVLTAVVIPMRSDGDVRTAAGTRAVAPAAKAAAGHGVYDGDAELWWDAACELSENELDNLETDLALLVFN